MERWQKILRNSLTKPDEIAKRFNIPLADIQEVEQEFKIRITPHYLSLIKEKGDPIYRQIVPDKNELVDNELMEDPLGEDRDSPVHNVVHRYPDRVLFLISHVCSSYCRFCTRSRIVGDPHAQFSSHTYDQQLAYIADNPQIRDVLLSGGDPLTFSDDKL